VPEVTSYATGQPCWADVTSPDVDAAAAFYGELFGWRADKAPQPEAGGYTMFSKDGKYTAAASPPMPGTEEVPSHWRSTSPPMTSTRSPTPCARPVAR
jgi:predicted enzyme related to lactoylglutathione lyase